VLRKELLQNLENICFLNTTILCKIPAKNYFIERKLKKKSKLLNRLGWNTELDGNELDFKNF
jgi:hypothetical protein